MKNRSKESEGNYDSSLSTWHAIREVKRVCAEYGINGDPIKPTAKTGDLHEERLIGFLISKVPSRVRRQSGRIVRESVRRIVLNRRTNNE